MGSFTVGEACDCKMMCRTHSSLHPWAIWVSNKLPYRENATGPNERKLEVTIFLGFNATLRSGKVEVAWEPQKSIFFEVNALAEELWLESALGHADSKPSFWRWHCARQCSLLDISEHLLGCRVGPRGGAKEKGTWRYKCALAPPGTPLWTGGLQRHLSPSFLPCPLPLLDMDLCSPQVERTCHCLRSLSLAWGFGICWYLSVTMTSFFSPSIASNP